MTHSNSPRPAIHPLQLAAPNKWDLIAFPLIVAVLVLLTVGARGTFAPLEAVQSTPISLDPAMLPGYAVRTVLRMLAAMVASLLEPASSSATSLPNWVGGTF